MILTKEQVKKLRKFFKDNKDVEEVTLCEESKSGIGQNLYARYTNTGGAAGEIDITDYESW